MSKNMKFRFVLFVAIVNFLALSESGSVSAEDESNMYIKYEAVASNYIAESSQKFFDIYDKISDETFKLDNADFENILNLNIDEITKNLTAMSNEVKEFPYEGFSETVQLGIQNLRLTPYLYILGEDYFKNVSVSTKILRSLQYKTNLCEFSESDIKDSKNCKIPYNPDVLNMIYDKTSEDKLKFYWKMWRENNFEVVPNQLNNFLQWLQQAAQMSEVTSLDLWYRIYGDKNFFAEIEKIREQIRPFYEQLHAYIRNQLQKNYPYIATDDKIPYHLLEQILAQIWTDYSILELPYPDEKLPQLDSIFGNSFTATNLAEKADEFYKSMGLEELPHQFWENRIKELPEKGSNCKPDIYDRSTNVYLKYCPGVDFKKFLQMHGYMGRLHYANQKKNLPYAYFQSFNFEVPVGEAIILSASTPKHLRTIGLLGDKKYGYKEQMNRLFKMAVHTVLNLEIYYAHSKIMNDLVAGKFTVTRTKIVYWVILENLLGLTIPSEKMESFDLPPKFYEDLENNHQTTKFVSETVGYQIYRSICLRIKQFMPGDEEQPLNMCDIYGNLEAGKALKEMMQLGSKKPWRQVLGRVTGSEAGIKADAILEYYEPLIKWLENYNKENNVPVGWKEMDPYKLVTIMRKWQETFAPILDD